MASPEEPPYYVLISHNSLLNNVSVPASSSLAHPSVIQYHYADDSPHALLPQYPGEHILVLDYDPSKLTLPTVKSLSSDLAVSGLRVTDAPGAGAADDEPKRNDKMYILETTAVLEEKCISVEDNDNPSPHSILARFKQRNTILRRALQYPEADPEDQSDTEPILASPPEPPVLSQGLPT
ncbi:uncharacterized protein FIBRA_02997 [Fibroporia radiculosa]|uniref:Uncharacterized protein n=1 Tax=Fibroporia radiculosa TaxID=599839 RepID=J4GN85_9APHY|nr:uncharacterized protein FIBRA_02997 [Fibroporia radiculosa]CCM00950.1 predicted protein [Fibroporia radiculosa]